MSEFIEIFGGASLKGVVQLSGAKNAALPILMASLLTDQPCKFTNVPNLEDVRLTLNLLEHFGANFQHFADCVDVHTPKLIATDASYSLVKALRASFWVLAPVLARGGVARVALPGGDAIGTRPVNIHLEALAKMGADIKLKHGVVYATAHKGLKPAKIEFSFASVGATHQILMAAALTPGVTQIKNAACEPEVEALAQMLTQMGAEIEGAGTPNIIIRGKKELGGANLAMIGDRVEAVTYLMAGAITKGSVEVRGIKPSYFGNFLDILKEMGLQIETSDYAVKLSYKNKLKPVHVSTAPFPGFATDFQALFMPLLTLVQGESTIEENVFESRFHHVSELLRMGANIDVEDRVAKIKGVDKLSAAPVEGYDIRGAACLILAGLAADGVTRVFEPHHLRRGYERLESKLSSLGAAIACKPEELEDSLLIGC